MKLKPIFKCHGGKYYLQDWIRSFFPAHKIFLDGCGGAGSIVINKDPSIDIYNEANPDVWSIVYHIKMKPEFLSMIEATCYNEATFQSAKEKAGDFELYGLERSWCELVKRRMSRGGLQRDFAWSNRERGGQPGDVNAWENFKKQLPKIRDRLKSIVLSCHDVIHAMSENDDKHTLIYLDPPYPKSTRTDKNSYGNWDWNDDKHEQLCKFSNILNAKIIISSYQNDIYDKLLNGWKRVFKEVPNHSGQNKEKQRRIECLYMNF